MNKRTNWLAVYDIRDVKRLHKVAKAMESFGIRVQKSIFELSCSENDIRHLRQIIRNIIDDEEDYILFFSVCERDWQKREAYGKSKLQDNYMDKPFVIL